MRIPGKKSGEKAKRMPVRLQLRNAQGEPVFDDRIDRLSLEESRVTELSILYFNDPEPCFIHRGAVLSRVFGELEAALSEDWIAVDQLENELQKHLSLYSAREVRIMREET